MNTAQAMKNELIAKWNIANFSPAPDIRLKLKEETVQPSDVPLILLLEKTENEDWVGLDGSFGHLTTLVNIEIYIDTRAKAVSMYNESKRILNGYRSPGVIWRITSISYSDFLGLILGAGSVYQKTIG